MNTNFKTFDLTQGTHLNKKLKDNYKYAYVSKLNTYDARVKEFLNKELEGSLEYYSFYIGLFFIYFLGLRPGYTEKTVSKYTGLLNLKNTEVMLYKDAKNVVRLNFNDKHGRTFDKNFIVPNIMRLRH